MIEPCLGKSITFIGMNCEQKGRTFNSAPQALYASTTSGIGSPLVLHRGNLKTCTPSCSAPTARISGFPLMSGTVKTPTISWPFKRRFLYTSKPNWDWPITATFNEPIALVDVKIDLLAATCTKRNAESIIRPTWPQFTTDRFDKSLIFDNCVVTRRKICGVVVEQKTLLSKLVGLDLRANHRKLRRATGQTGYIYERWYESRRFWGCVRYPILRSI